MKEFVLTQPYNSVEEMLDSAEMSIYKEELQQGFIENYAIVSRIGNRYDLDGNKIVEFAKNPFYPVAIFDAIVEEKVELLEEKTLEVKDMKYPEIENMIDEIVAKQVEGIKLAHEQEITELKAFHEDELATAKANAKAEAKEELLAKLNS